MSQDSKTSRDITYSALLRDANIKITGIAHFYSCYLRIKSCSFREMVMYLIIIFLYIIHQKNLSEAKGNGYIDDQ